MTQRTRRKIDAALKAKIELEALREHKRGHAGEIEKLQAKIGQLIVERDF